MIQLTKPDGARVGSNVIELAEDRKIGEGKYRKVFMISDTVCAKKMKSHRKKRYGFFGVDYPMQIYTRSKFGVADLNRGEVASYQKLAGKLEGEDEIRDCFVPVIGVMGSNGDSVLLQEVVFDYDGSVSPRLKDHGPVEDKQFWERLGTIKDFFLKNDVPYFDFREGNILVKRTDDGQKVPMFFDYKRMGPRTYPFQPLLRFPSIGYKKIERRYQRLVEQYSGVPRTVN